jgi:hypothetical protein
MCYNINYSPAKYVQVIKKCVAVSTFHINKNEKSSWIEDEIMVLTSTQEAWKNFGNFQHCLLPDSCIPNGDVRKINNKVCTEWKKAEELEWTS